MIISLCMQITEKAMAPHSCTLAQKIPWMEEPGRLQSMGQRRVGRTERPHFHFSLSCIGEGNGNPLHCSCLESLRDGGAWWAAVCGVAQSRARLERLSSSSRFTRWFSVTTGSVETSSLPPRESLLPSVNLSSHFVSPSLRQLLTYFCFYSFPYSGHFI